MNPYFNFQELQGWLKQSRITYVSMGDKLGGRPPDSDCYDQNGQIVYEIIKEKPYFLEGLQRLKVAFAKRLPVALMCAEVHPQECHRCTLIGRALAEEGLYLNHIDNNGLVKDQVTVFNMATGGLPETDLFGNKIRF